MSHRDPRSPCLRHHCDACCYDTSMSLTEADVRRLERSGRRGFYRLHPDGTLRLRNVDGHCVFLDASSGCTAYPDRPDGCVLYPLIWFTADAEAGLHDFCPYRHEFRCSSGDRAWLARSIATEDAEVAARRRAAASGLRDGSDAEVQPESAE